MLSQIKFGEEGQAKDGFNIIASAVSIAYNRDASEENIREALFEALDNLIDG